MKHVVVIGGGFSGAVTAVNLARLTNAPLAVTFRGAEVVVAQLHLKRAHVQMVAKSYADVIEYSI